MLKVGIRHFPPCVIIKDNGSITGFEIELWREIVRRADLVFDYAIVPFTDLVGSVDAPSGLTTGDIDVAFSGITITGDRAERLAVCHTHLSTGLKIASPSKIKIPYKKIFTILCTFISFSIVLGILLWVLEHGNELISDKPFPGIPEAIWCIFTTISTVGYGQIAPTTWRGRCFTVFVMLLGIGYFCTVASTLTAHTNFEGNDFETFTSIEGASIAVKQGSTSEKIAKEHKALVLPVESAEEAISLVSMNKVDAALVDAPIADYCLKQGSRLVLSEWMARQDYGIFLRKGDSRVELLNKAILEIIEDGTYNEIYSRWF